MLDLPKELQRPSRRWAEKRFLDIRYWNELDRGGHFAAFEQPKLFVDEVRSFFRLVPLSRSNRPWCEALLSHFALKKCRFRPCYQQQGSRRLLARNPES